MPRGYKLRNRLRRRDGDSCFVCGKEMNFDYGPKPAPNDATIEHVIEQREGGTWHFSNLALSHGHCNMQRSRYSLFVKRWGEQAGSRNLKWLMPAWPALED